MTTRWTRAQARLAADQPLAALPVIAAADVVPIAQGLDLWDMWPVADAAGRTVLRQERSWWFFLAAPRLDDPDLRHDVAHVRLTSHGGDGWRDHGEVFAIDFTPGSRDWSGSAVLAGDGETLTMYFTAAGRRGGAPSFEQRLFETRGRFVEGYAADWSPPVESVAADGRLYAAARDAVPIDGRIKGFRDPGYFRDPADGAEYLLFVGSSGIAGEVLDGVIGVAGRTGGEWMLRPPLIDATGVNSELERPHIVVHAGCYYLFWSTQGKRFADGLGAPTGLYGMVADRFAGPWRPLNGSGLVAANPPAEPHQAYCWWVTGELDVVSFVDLWGLAGASPARAATRRERFGGTAAPWFRLALAGDRATIVVAAPDQAESRSTNVGGIASDEASSPASRA